MNSNRDLFPGALEMMILQILRRNPMHGYALAREIQQRSEQLLQVEEGSLYPALHRLEEEGLIKAQWEITANNRRARFYEITGKGLKQLDQEEARWRAITAAVGHVLRHA
jgi:transcriptional regulator